MNLPTQRQRISETSRTARPRHFFSVTLLAFFALFAVNSSAQDLSALETSIRSGTLEQKREALYQIRNLRSEITSRAAIPALTDPDPIVRATAAASVVFLPKPEAVAALTPLLSDKEQFVRKEVAYALGEVKSLDAAASLIVILPREKDLEVKTAVAVALGQTGSNAAVEPLIAILKRKPDDDEEFLRRAAARSIGQIAQIIRSGEERVVTPQNFLADKYKVLDGNYLTAQSPVFDAAVVTLRSVLQNRNEADDTRREAAFALGAISSPSSRSVLRAAVNNPDPYLAEIAREALSKIAKATSAH